MGSSPFGPPLTRKLYNNIKQPFSGIWPLREEHASNPEDLLMATRLDFHEVRWEFIVSCQIKSGFFCWRRELLQYLFGIMENFWFGGLVFLLLFGIDFSFTVFLNWECVTEYLFSAAVRYFYWIAGFVRDRQFYYCAIGNNEYYNFFSSPNRQFSEINFFSRSTKIKRGLSVFKTKPHIEFLLHNVDSNQNIKTKHSLPNHSIRIILFIIQN